MKKKNEWYLHKQLVTSKYGVQWKIAISRYWKDNKNWTGFKPNDFQYKIINGEITEVRNDVLLSSIFTKN